MTAAFIPDWTPEWPVPTWFDLTARENFEKFVIATGYRKVLQLGCFTGDATVWLADQGCFVTDIDTFEGSDEHDGIDMEKVQKIYRARVAGLPVEIMVGRTDHWLSFLRKREDMFDFIYVDADHHAASVLSDAVMSWPLLASGGLMAFDDYVWRKEGTTPYERPANGINAFMLAYGDQLDVIEQNAQLWVRKR